MGIIKRWKGAITKKNAKSRSPPTEVLVRNTQFMEQELTLAKQRSRDNSSLNTQILRFEEPFVETTPIHRDPSEKQRMHFDRLFSIGSRFVNEGNIEIVAAKLPTANREIAREEEKKEEDLDVGADVDYVKQSGESYTFIDVFSGLSLCGCGKATLDKNPEQPRKFEEEKEMEKPEVPHQQPHPPPLLVADFPTTISFTERRDASWTDNHVLLSEMNDEQSLQSSLLSRIKWVRRPRAPKIMRVYVEAPKRVQSARSEDLSELTGLFH
jgi:hypothetical protein